MNPLIEQLRTAQRTLGLKNQEMAAELHVTPEWYSKIINGKRDVSHDLRLRFEDLLRRRIEPSSSTHPNLGGHADGRVEEAQGSFGVVASRIPQRRSPSNRRDCEDYVRKLLDAAESSQDPNAWPVILHRLRQQFPITEWLSEKDEEQQ